MPLLAWVALISGCRSGGGVSLSQLAGHYEGFVVATDSSGVSNQSSLFGDVAKVSDSELKLTLSGELQALKIDFDFSFKSPSDMMIESDTGYFTQPIELKSSGNSCFSSADLKDEVCLSGNEVELKLSGSRFVLDQMPATVLPAMESSQDFTIDQLIARTQNLNFANEVAFQTVVQAKLTAQTAYSNLLPHLNIGTALDIIQGTDPKFSLITMIRAIGDLVPFFLPNRWDQAQALQDQAQADFDAYRVVQADSMNIVQGVALSVLRNEQTLDRLGQTLASLITIRDEILAGEHSGSIQIGTSDDINSIINSTQASIEDLKQKIHQELTALSQGAGFMNPDAVSHVLPIDVLPPQGPISGGVPYFQQLALSRSLDLLEIDHMIEAAKATRAAKKFQWLDPSGDDQGSLGLGLVSYVDVGSSSVDQVYKLRDSSQSMLLKTVEDAITESDDVYQQYVFSVQASNFAQLRIDQALTNFRNGTGFSISELVSALQDKTAGDVNQINAQYAFVTLQAQVDFLTFSGIYAPLLSEKP